ARHAVAIDDVAGDGDERFRGDAATPERLAQPVADLGRRAVHVLLQHEADPAHGFAVDHDGERRFGTGAAHRADESLAVALRVGVWKSIAQVDPDAPVVGVAY